MTNPATTKGKKNPESQNHKIKTQNHKIIKPRITKSCNSMVVHRRFGFLSMLGFLLVLLILNQTEMVKGGGLILRDDFRWLCVLQDEFCDLGCGFFWVVL